MMFGGLRERNAHLNTVHALSKPFGCTLCGRRFDSGFGLRSHKSNDICVREAAALAAARDADAKKVADQLEKEEYDEELESLFRALESDHRDDDEEKSLFMPL